MLFSLSIIFIVGLLFAFTAQLLRLPRIIGMLAGGIIIGPYVLNFIDVSVLNISAELRQIALIIILIKAGLSLNLADLKKVGRSAVMMSFVPACFEIIGYFCFAPLLFGISGIEALVMGAVLGAVSPAVVVPRMVNLIEQKRGTEKGIPQMILAGASCDDIFVIVLFSTFTTMAQGGEVSIRGFVNIPVSIILGVMLGVAVSLILYKLFEISYKKGYKVRNTTKVIIMLATAFMLMRVEKTAEKYVAVSGLLAVVAMACVMKIKFDAKLTERLSEKFGKLWIAAEIVLFVLVGAAVDIRYTLTAGIAAVGMIFIALFFRLAGVMLCVAGTKLNIKEKIFCAIAYMPKATVQAAIGSVPLAMGLPCGMIVLSVAVLAIIITAPLGALGIDIGCKKMLTDNSITQKVNA